MCYGISQDEWDESIKPKYRTLNKGEIVLETDQIFDHYTYKWRKPVNSVGKPAPDLNFGSRKQFRRKI